MAWTTPKTDFADGNVLTAAQMNAIGNDLQYLYDSGGQVISTTTLSGAATDVAIPAGLAMARLIVRNFEPSTAAYLGCKLDTGSIVGSYYMQGISAGTVFGVNTDGANALLTPTSCYSGAAAINSRIVIDLIDYEDTTAEYKLMTVQGFYRNGSNQISLVSQTIGAVPGTVGAVTSVRFNAPTATNQGTPTATMTGTVVLIGY